MSIGTASFGTASFGTASFGTASSATDQVFDSWNDVLYVPISAAAILLAVIASVRLIGLRSFSKMSSFDFAVTVSIGSILGAVATTSTTIVNGVLAVLCLLVLQAAISWLRVRRARVRESVDNTPIVLMDGRELLDENLRAARVTREDVFAKLRAANVARLDDVRAVVLETTGDISVVHGEHGLDPELLQDVRTGPAVANVESLSATASSDTNSSIGGSAARSGGSASGPVRPGRQA